MNGPLVCFNIFHMIRELGNRPPAAREICLHLSPAVPLIDHTTFEYLQYLEDDLNSHAAIGPNCRSTDGTICGR